jgi:hypothetical protein
MKHNNKEIKRSALEAIESELELLSVSSRLCTLFTDLIAAKYDLHGTIPQAVKKLKSIKTKMKKTPASDQLTSEILGRKEREEMQVEQASNDKYWIGIQEALIEGDYRKLGVINIRRALRDIDMHEKKECICFSTSSTIQHTIQ